MARLGDAQQFHENLKAEEQKESEKDWQHQTLANAEEHAKLVINSEQSHQSHLLKVRSILWSISLRITSDAYQNGSHDLREDLGKLLAGVLKESSEREIESLHLAFENVRI